MNHLRALNFYFSSYEFNLLKLSKCSIQAWEEIVEQSLQSLNQSSNQSLPNSPWGENIALLDHCLFHLTPELIASRNIDQRYLRRNCKSSNKAYPHEKRGVASIRFSITTRTNGLNKRFKAFKFATCFDAFIEIFSSSYFSSERIIRLRVAMARFVKKRSC